MGDGPRDRRGGTTGEKERKGAEDGAPLHRLEKGEQESEMEKRRELERDAQAGGKERHSPSRSRRRDGRERSEESRRDPPREEIQLGFYIPDLPLYVRRATCVPVIVSDPGMPLGERASERLGEAIG